MVIAEGYGKSTFSRYLTGHMNIEMTLGLTTLLPKPPAGWFDYDYTVLRNGSLGLIRTDRDILADDLRMMDEYRRGNMYAYQTDIWNGHIRLSAFDGIAETPAMEVSAGRRPHVDQMVDGRWLIVSRWAAHGENNARFYMADGMPAGAFTAGDCISHIRCAADGTIWAGYFDEGVLRGPNEDGSKPVSSSGIAHFGSNGSILWRFNDEEPFDHFILDCYAMTLEGNVLWCCPYRNFPIVKIDQDVVHYWENKVMGAQTLAVDNQYVLLAGGYNDKSNRLTLLQLEGGQAIELGEWYLQSREHGTAGLIQGQGAILHVVGQRRWTQLSVANMFAAVNPDQTP